MAVNVLITAREVDTESKVVASSNDTVSTQQSQAVTRIKSSGASNVIVTMYASRMASAAWSEAKSLVNFAKSQYGDFTGDYIGQTKIDLAFEQLNTAVSLSSSIVGGAISGAMAGGVPGAVVGAAVSTVISLGSLANNYAQNTHNTKMRIANANATASLNASRIGAILIDGSRG